MYLIQIEELDTYTNERKRYYMRDASDNRRPAVVTREVANHCVANMGNDYRYRRHATAVRIMEAVA